MPGLLFFAFQKFYSALNSLDRFNKEKSFFENISSLDNFFSEFRNVTFVMQKSLAHTGHTTAYEINRQKYLSDCRWFVDKRNETTKQQPFQLEKQIEITVYFPDKGIRLYSEKYVVENDVEMSTLIERFKQLFSEINSIEVFFSAEFAFYESDSQEDLFDKLILGIQSMKDFLNAMQVDINEQCKLCEHLKQKIDKFDFSILPRDMMLIIDYAYYPEKDEFERAGRVTLVLLGQNKAINRMPLTCFYTELFSNFGDNYFQIFVAIHAIQKNTELLPALMVVYQDNTFELDAFNADIKTTVYRKLNEVAKRIADDEVKEIYYMQTYVVCPTSSLRINMTSKERLAHAKLEFLTFMRVDCFLKEEEYVFDGAKLNNMEYIVHQIKFGGKNKLELGKVNMMPIINAFQKRNDEKF